MCTTFVSNIFGCGEYVTEYESKITLCSVTVVRLFPNGMNWWLSFVFISVVGENTYGVEAR
jgi:hypothetical protein